MAMLAVAAALEAIKHQVCQLLRELLIQSPLVLAVLVA
jgi:hypothetical protein